MKHSKLISIIGVIVGIAVYLATSIALLAVIIGGLISFVGVAIALSAKADEYQRDIGSQINRKNIYNAYIKGSD